MSTKKSTPTGTAGSTSDGAKIQTPEGLQIQPYLFFEGVCEDALTFYRTALGAEDVHIMRYKDAPEGSGMSSPAMENKVMHASFRVSGTTILASDGRCDRPQSFQGFALTLTVPTVDEANRYFDALEKGGRVQMPLSTTFFSPRFGMVNDRFGIPWMIYVIPA